MGRLVPRCGFTDPHLGDGVRELCDAEDGRKDKQGEHLLGSNDRKGIDMLNIHVRDHEVLPKLACDLTEIAVA